jgi:hypothetical protein
MDATQSCREVLSLAAPRAVVDVYPTNGGRIESGDWARLDLLRTTTVQFAYLNPLDERRVVLRVFPGDTLSQARVLYKDATRIDSLLRLKRSGDWIVKPNMHFGFREGGHAWLDTSVDVESYTNYWLAAMQRTGQLDRDEWPKFMDELVRRGIASPEDSAVFDKAFTETKRKSASPRPGLWCERAMSNTLDQRDALAAEVVDQLSVVLRALREPLTTFV